MKILYFGNNWVGWKVLEWLAGQEEEIVGLVIHRPPRQMFVEEILETAHLSDEQVFYGDKLRDPEVLASITRLKPDIGLSVFFSYLLPPPLLEKFPGGIMNLHPACLPYNRGEFPNVWSIVDGTPSGVTLHYVDEGIDTGDIVARKEVPVDPADTGETLYRRLELASVQLFRESWPSIRAGNHTRIPQVPTEGTYHRRRDVESIDRIDLEKEYTAKKLIDILRARTFPPYKGAYFEVGGKKVFLGLHLEYDQDTDQGR